MKNLKKIVLGLMILLAAFTFVGCPTDVPEQKPSAGGNVEGGDEEGNQPADDEYIVMYNCEIFTSFSTLEEFEAFLSKLDKYDPDTDSGDYYFDDAFTVVLTEAGYKKLYDDNEEEILPANDFKGNVYVASGKIFGFSTFYAIEFENETAGKKIEIDVDDEGNNYLLETPFTYTVKEDVATITLIYEDGYKEIITTSKLVNNEFSFEVEDGDFSILFSCEKNDKSVLEKWTVYFNDEECLNDYYLSILDQIANAGLEENIDYDLDKENKKFNLTEAGYKKLYDDNEEEILPVNAFKGNVYVMTSQVEEMEFTFPWIIGYVEFTDDTNCKIVMLSSDEQEEEFLEELPFTYTVEDDVATLTSKEESEVIVTSKLEKDVFTIEFDGLDTICEKGDTSLFVKGYEYYDGEKTDPLESYLVSIVNMKGLVEEDYVVENGNLVLTDAGYEKLYGKGDNEDDIISVNGFEGNVYVVSKDIEIDFIPSSYILGYIEFTDADEGKIVYLSEESLDEHPFSYTVEDNVATLTSNEMNTVTSKLEDDVFTFEDDGFEMTCKKGDPSLFEKGNAYYGEQCIAEGQYLADIVNEYGFTDRDYVIEDGNLVIIPWTFINPNGASDSSPYFMFAEQSFMYGLEEKVHYTVDEENRTVAVNTVGFAIMNEPRWGIVVIIDEYSTRTDIKPNHYQLLRLKGLNFVEGEDYIVDDEKCEYILTTTGSDKWKSYYSDYE